MTKHTNGAAEAEKTIEVKLLRGYVPANPQEVPGSPGVFVKHLPGEVVELSRSEAKRAIAAGIAAITADII